MVERRSLAGELSRARQRCGLASQYCDRLFSRTVTVAVDKLNSGDGQGSAEIDHQPRPVGFQGMGAAEALVSRVAAAVDRVAGPVLAVLVRQDADLSGGHVDRHVAHRVPLR